VLQRTDTAISFEPFIFVMETQRAPRVISADTLRRGVVITFDDGKSAL
jgi:hypothetical protein